MKHFNRIEHKKDILKFANEGKGQSIVVVVT